MAEPLKGDAARLPARVLSGRLLARGWAFERLADLRDQVEDLIGELEQEHLLGGGVSYALQGAKRDLAAAAKGLARS
jgi:hypothetical protein